MEGTEAAGNDAVGTRFVRALSGRNWNELEGLFGPSASMRALVPRGLREASGGEAASAQFRQWFAKADVFQVLSFTVEPLRDKVHIAYRLRLHQERWYTCEQQTFCVISGERIEKMDLLCSGFRPEPPALEEAAAERAGSPSS